MKIAVFGGSFNPVHIGHLALADEVCVSLGYDKILFVPSFSPPHKTCDQFLSPEIRLKMTELAVEDDGRFEVEDCEIKRGGVSYTYDTVCFLEEKYKNSLEGKIGLVMGADLFSTFHLWRNAELLSEKCTLILARRQTEKCGVNFSSRATGDYKKFSEQNGNSETDFSSPLFKNAVFLNNELLAVSSSSIRERLAKKMAFKYLIPEKVFKYITDGNFYGTQH